MEREHLLRQSDIIPVETLGTPIRVIGAGAIGSFTILQLAKMGFCDIEVWDDDEVSNENLSNQFFKIKDVGRKKVLALQDICHEFADCSIDPKDARYVKGQFPGILIVAVDNMAARRLVLEQHRMMAATTELIIDPRMGAETALLHCYNPMDEKQCKTYEKTLYSDDDAVADRCTAKSTMYTVNLLSGLVAKTVKDFLVEKKYLKNVSWDIKSFAIEAWNNEGRNPNRLAPGQSFQHGGGRTDGTVFHRAILESSQSAELSVESIERVAEMIRRDAENSEDRWHRAVYGSFIDEAPRLIERAMRNQILYGQSGIRAQWNNSSDAVRYSVVGPQDVHGTSDENGDDDTF